ncbi:hypothetical protein E2562_004141 [Oryza meyeriana var. granulata]|uniref:Uncharacterized protein n=1 Tax=Oryza meyeriana var. granulata TaxID=110450 RepID=A0A6G1EV92_9ORYZ|nr:hypothetical protein E2562_004141 [Oryza meyeriana var. granulata]
MALRMEAIDARLEKQGERLEQVNGQLGHGFGGKTSTRASGCRAGVEERNTISSGDSGKKQQRRRG